MIRVNVEVNNKPWNKKIKNPKKYFSKKLKKISKIVPFFKVRPLIKASGAISIAPDSIFL